MEWYWIYLLIGLGCWGLFSVYILDDFTNIDDDKFSEIGKGFWAITLLWPVAIIVLGMMFLDNTLNLTTIFSPWKFYAKLVYNNVEFIPVVLLLLVFFL